MHDAESIYPLNASPLGSTMKAAERTTGARQVVAAPEMRIGIRAAIAHCLALRSGTGEQMSVMLHGVCESKE